jgi:hypothetical protein
LILLAQNFPSCLKDESHSRGASSPFLLGTCRGTLSSSQACQNQSWKVVGIIFWIIGIIFWITEVVWKQSQWRRGRTSDLSLLYSFWCSEWSI